MRRLLAGLLAACLILPASVWAAITEISVATHTGNPGAGPASLTIPTVSADDFLVLISLANNNVTSLAVTDNDSGGNTWTELTTGTHGASGLLGTIRWKRATGSTTGKVITITAGGATPGCMAAAMLVLRGVPNSGTVIEALSAAAVDGTSHAAITTTINGAEVVFGLPNTTPWTSAWQMGGAAFTFGAEAADTSSAGCHVVALSKNLATAGSSGTFTWTGSPSSIHWAFAIKPSVSAATCVSLLSLLGVGSC